ncbi:fungal-specific transcription factor domain-containing protein [Lasiosphaeria miniovina]|uniref:Fungal-specific transcription factor domain-containing protein n=1 Tax=Lasiosphaeria miniovina TaxID=1954250 RepID=A0AA40ALK9_9PEZI|nr:fungal-specific transcription factor domain-containing protein [Lasiosphaeria miniovina]KAK0718035.1 fungal-specific transcription factor domain-containing protein [Lasiosphaeria miniovina]
MNNTSQMLSGSRSRTGCYTCRMRKKKCDEQQPCCDNCKSRNLQCYGYDVPPPDWMQGKRNWKEVMDTEEARRLRSVADAQYKARRRYGQEELAKVARGNPNCPQTGELVISPVGRLSAPESLWWDGAFCTSLPTGNRPHEDARLVMLYLDFIFPIQFGFCPMSTAADHSWLMSGLCGNKARYHSALSVSASFQASLCEPEKVDGKGLSLEVAERQAIASSDLRMIIMRFNQQGHAPRDVARIGLQILEVMHQLLSLEVFSMLEGTWQLHHQATLTLLDTIHTYRPPGLCDQIETESRLSPIEMALKDFSSPDLQRTFEFHVTCVVWVDIIANATYGSPLQPRRHFDYVPYLHANDLKTHEVMGCHSSVMASITEITRLADWKGFQLQSNSLDTEELSGRAASMAARLRDQLLGLEQQCMLGMTELEANSRLVTLQFVSAAQMLEALPEGLVIRANWAFTITGCLAGETLHDRFRGLITRLVEQNRPLGMSWKGLMVMEECWRLRESQRELGADCDWKMATRSLGKRVLLV